MEKKIGRKKCVYKRRIFCFLSAFFDVDLGFIYFLVIYFRVLRIFMTPLLFKHIKYIHIKTEKKNILWSWVEGAACASGNELWHLSYSKPSQRLCLTAEERGDVLFWIFPFHQLFKHAEFRKNRDINFAYFTSVILHQSENVENIQHFSLKDILLCPSIQSFIQALAGGSKAKGI